MGRVTRGLSAALLLCLGGVAGAQQAPLADYDVTVAPGLDSLSVHACFSGAIPQALIGPSHLAAPALSHASLRFMGHSVSLQPRGHRLALAPVPEDACVDYTVDLARIREAEANFSTAMQRGTSLVLGTGTWLWQPADPQTRLRFRFHLPQGMRLSAPWQETAPTDYQSAATPYTWQSSVMLGDFTLVTISVGDCRFEIAIAGETDVNERRIIRDWVRGAAGSASQVLGEFPVRRVQVLVVPLNAGTDTAAYAATARGGGPAVHLTFNPSLPESAYRDDWILVHEFSHLLLPYVDHDASWLSEGLASYYQTVLRARGGQMTAAAAWSALVAGLDRGDRNTDPQLTLAQASRAAALYGQIMRVYWEGAAIFFNIDVRLRQASNGRQSLDSVLRQFYRCCREPDRTWSGDEMLRRLDSLSGTTLFTDTAHRYVYSRYFPNLRPMLRDLGIRSRGDQLIFDDAAPDAKIRRAIMRSYPAAESSSGHSSGPPMPRQARNQLSGASPSRRLPGAR